MEIFSFSFLAHTCFAWTFTSIKLTLYMLCFSCTEIPMQYLPYLYTDITIPFPFFANIFAYLHICPKHKLFPSISSCSHYASPNSACFENCSTSLTTHRSLGCSLRLSFTLSQLAIPVCVFVPVSVFSKSVFSLHFHNVHSYLTWYLACVNPCCRQLNKPPTALNSSGCSSRSSRATVRFVWQLQNL